MAISDEESDLGLGNQSLRLDLRKEPTVGLRQGRLMRELEHREVSPLVVREQVCDVMAHDSS